MIEEEEADKWRKREKSLLMSSVEREGERNRRRFNVKKR
jgi:hypothetical protein